MAARCEGWSLAVSSLGAPMCSLSVTGKHGSRVIGWLIRATNAGKSSSVLTVP
jgi:hypothetical protein